MKNKKPPVIERKSEKLLQLMAQRDTLYKDQRTEMDDLKKSYAKKFEAINKLIDAEKNVGIKKQMNQFLKR